MIKEIVIGETKSLNTIEVSFSQLSCFRRCQQKHHYKYIMNLERRRKGLPLERGSVIHKCLESLYKTGDWKKEWRKYKKEFKKLFEEEKELYGDLPKEIFRLMSSYIRVYRYDKRWKIEGVEVPFACRLPKSRVVLKGIIDLVMRDKLGLWAVEHKTHKNLPSSEYRSMDVQSTLYYYILNSFAGLVSSDEVMGVIFNYFRTKAPTVPRLLKNGTLSKAKIVTDPHTYKKAIKKHGLNVEDYRDVLQKLDASTFFSRRRISKPDSLVSKVITETIITGHLIEPFLERRLLPTRTILPNCTDGGCEYLPICQGELHGYDTSYIIQKEFKEREKKEVVS